MKPPQLTVKELAAELEVGVRFIYEMRRCGFPMYGTGYHNQTTSRAEAVQWLLENNFRMIHGRGCTDSVEE